MSHIDKSKSFAKSGKTFIKRGAGCRFFCRSMLTLRYLPSIITGHGKLNNHSCSLTDIIPLDRVFANHSLDRTMTVVSNNIFLYRTRRQWNRKMQPVIPGSRV